MLHLPEELTPLPGLVPETVPEVPATPRDAASVVLTRDGVDGPEVFLLRRVVGMAFAGGMTVFPGGGVDRRDADTSVAWIGPEPAWWGQRFDCAPEQARALVCAAVRETFEESGVLLAGPDAHHVVTDTAVYADARARLVNREVSLAQFLADAGLALRADLLRPLAHWLTPVFEPRRYDTRFFLAVIPDGQKADAETTEASDARWQRPVDALDDWRAGQRLLLPPTWSMLDAVAAHDTTADALAADRKIVRIMPKVQLYQGKERYLLPGDADYDASDAR